MREGSEAVVFNLLHSARFILVLLYDMATTSAWWHVPTVRYDLVAKR